MAGGAIAPSTPLICTGPVSYKGHDALRRDLRISATRWTRSTEIGSGEAFVPAIAPSKVGANCYYDSEDEYLFAVADALRTEYEAIVDAGFILQIDDPYLTEIYGLPANRSPNSTVAPSSASRRSTERSGTSPRRRSAFTPVTGSTKARACTTST